MTDDTLAPGFTATVKLPATVDFKVTSVTNCATVTSKSDANPSNNEGCATNDVTPTAYCDMTVKKEMPKALVSGEMVTFTITVANAGNTACTGAATVKDKKVNGVSLTAATTPVGSGWTCSIASTGLLTCTGPPSVPPKGSVVVTVTAVVTGLPGSHVRNCATIVHPDDARPVNQSCADADVIPSTPNCDLKVTKTMNPAAVTSGMKVIVTLTAVNVGGGDCPGPTALEDLQPAGMKFLAAPKPVAGTTGWTCSLSSSDLGRCTGTAALPPLGKAAFNFSATVTATSGVVENCATVTNAADTLTGNNKRCARVGIVAVVECDLEIEKEMSPSPLKSGKPATVKLTVKNVGKGTCKSTADDPTVVTDGPVVGMEFTAQPSAPGGWLCGRDGLSEAGCLSELNLGPGASVTITVKASVTAPKGGTVENCATVVNPNDSNVDNNTKCVSSAVK